MTRVPTALTATAEQVQPATEQVPFVVLSGHGHAAGPVELRIPPQLAVEVRAAMDTLAVLDAPARPATAPLTVALPVTGGQCGLDPDAALLDLDAQLAHHLLAEMEQVAHLSVADDRVLSVDRTDWRLTYLTASSLDDREPLDDSWALLDAAQAAEARAAQDDDALRLVGETRVTTAAGVFWRCYPKHGAGEFSTGELSRPDLERLLQMLLVPAYAHLARWVDPAAPRPTLSTPEGRALWELFDAVMGQANDEGISPTSGADDAAALYTVLGRFGLRVP